MGGAIFTLVKRLLLALAVLALLAAGVVYLFGPHLSVATAYAAYKAAYDARDGATVARMTAPSGIAFFEKTRKLALSAPRDIVAALTFRDRAEVFALRSRVLDGSLQRDVLSRPDAVAAYAAYVQSLAARPSALPAAILFAVPTGSATARGYFDPAPGSGAPLVSGLMVLAWGMHGNFENTAEGWQVDMTPAVESSAAENEHLAVQMEPTGNAYLYQMLGAVDAAAQDRLWQPLQQ